MFTLGLIFIARVGAHIPLPGTDTTAIQTFLATQGEQSSGLFGLMNMFTGGALLNCAVCALGIMPYISSSIIMQLMTAVFPSLSRLQQEGDLGRQKLTQYGRYLTVAICAVQGGLLALALSNSPETIFHGFTGRIVIVSPVWFFITSVVFITAGTMLLMWLGERITQKGIGNGVSVLITVGILDRLPNAIGLFINKLNPPAGTEGMNPAIAILMFLLLIATIAGMVMVSQGMRKIPVQHAKRVIGRKVVGGQSSFLPLKINYAGVMPVIFAGAILTFLYQIFTQLSQFNSLSFLQSVANQFAGHTTFYFVFYSFLILIFSYFWVSIQFKPIQIADELKKSGGYVPGVRPGEPTAKFLDFVMTRLTLAGSIFLLIIALFPNLVYSVLDVPMQLAQLFGGTGMLITVGVVLETMKQVETALLQRHYDGFLKKRKSGSRTAVAQTVDMQELKSLRLLWLFLIALLLFGIASHFIRIHLL